MKKKLTKIIPILISCIIGFGVITFGWIIQDVQLKGITVRSATGGVALQVRGLTDTNYTNEVAFSDNIALLPCIKVDAQLMDENGTDVSCNPDYVKEISMFVKPSEKAKLYATVEVDGGLPIQIDCNNIDVTGTTEVMAINAKDTRLDFRIWIDGETYTAAGTANITITLHAEKYQ